MRAGRFPRQAWLWSVYWRLYALWNLLRQAVPEIELPLEPGMRWNIRYRLHRRVIEIRDAQLVLRPYSVTAIARMAAAMAAESGLSPDRAAAVTEAAIIISVLRFRLCGSVCVTTAFPRTMLTRCPATTSVPRQPGSSRCAAPSAGPVSCGALLAARQAGLRGTYRS